jgi:hypothetical protein
LVVEARLPGFTSPHIIILFAVLGSDVPALPAVGTVIHIVVDAIAFCTNPVVATFVELSPVLCVVAVVPFGNAGVPDKFAAVPVMFEFTFATCTAAPPFSDTVKSPFVSNAACDVPACGVSPTPGTGPLTDHGPVPIICPPTVTFPLKFALVPPSGPLTVVVPVRVADDKLGEDVVAIWLGAPPFAEM